MAHTPRPSRSTTTATSATQNEPLLDVEIRTVKAFLIDGYNQYERAFKASDLKMQMYWDGYIRACHQLMEAHGQ